MKNNNKTVSKWLYVSLTGCMLTLPLSVWGQGKTITGSVIDADDGSPLMGATIMVEGSKDGTVTDMDGNFKMNVNGGVCNPRGLVDQYDSRSTVKRLIGSFDVDYKLHFFPDVKLHATIGTDVARGEGTVYVPTTAASNFSTLGLDYGNGPQKNTNQLMTLYANYSHYFEPARSNVEVTAGYDYQYWKSTTPMYVTRNAKGDELSTVKTSDYRHVLKSYYGRLNYSSTDATCSRRLSAATAPHASPATTAGAPSHR